MHSTAYSSSASCPLDSPASSDFWPNRSCNSSTSVAAMTSHPVSFTRYTARGGQHGSRHDKAAPTRTLQLARTVVDSTTVGVAECGVVDGALSKLDRLLLRQVVPPAAAPPGTHTSAWVGGAMRHYTRVAWSHTYLESRTPYAYMDPEPTEKYGMVSFACSRVASLST